MPTVSIAGQTIEVYSTLANANAYFAAAFHGSPWAAAESSTRIKALVTAGSVFDRTPWRGSPTQPIDKTQPQPASTQPIAWPRASLFDRDGVALSDSVIPYQIVNGNLEYALALINDAAVQTEVSTGTNTKRTRTKEKVDVIEVENEFEYFQPTLKTATKFPTIVQDLVGFWLASSVGATVPLAGGTDVCSAANADWGTQYRGWP